MTCDEVEAKYPHHFSGPRGIECDDGWALLINDFIEEIDQIPGGKEVVFFSIKEKFGRLRVDVHSTPDGLYADAYYRIEAILEKKSASVCERCGEPGTPRGGSWMKTLCDKHEAERQTR